MNTPQRFAVPCVAASFRFIKPLSALSIPVQKYSRGAFGGSMPVRVNFLLVAPFKRTGTAHPIQAAINKELGLESESRPVRMRIRMSGHSDSLVFIRLPIKGLPVTDPLNWRSLTVNPDLWNGPAKQLKGDSDNIRFVNDLLTKTVADIQAIYEQLLNPTPETIKAEYLNRLLPFKSDKVVAAAHVIKATVVYADTKPGTPVHDALTAYIDTLAHQCPPLSPMTVSKWRDGANYLQMYLSATGQESAPCDTVKVGWAKRFHSWLLSEPTLPKGGKLKMSAGTASRHVLRLKALFAALVDEEVFDRNPLADLRLPKDKTRPVHFLERQHLSALLALPVPATDYGSALWWMKLMCVTGMDYPDAQLYAADSGYYEQTADGLDKIVINRSKSPFNECHIYMLDEVKKVMAERPATLRVLSHDLVNWHIKKGKVAEQIGFAHAFTCKIARKTAGNYFLRKGFSIQAVSGIMGHDTIATTEMHYVKVTGAIVDQEAQNLMGTETPVYRLNRAA